MDLELLESEDTELVLARTREIGGEGEEMSVFGEGQGEGEEDEVELQPGGDETAGAGKKRLVEKYACAAVVCSAVGLVLLAVTVACMITLLSTSGAKEHSPNGYGFVLDLGSSGSRVYAYEWKHGDAGVEEADLGQLTALMTEDGEKMVQTTTPGVSYFAGYPQGAVRTLIPLLEFAKDIVEDVGQVQAECPLLCYATGGMRALDEKDREELESAIRSYITENYDFLMEDSEESIRTISGHEEAFFDYVTVQQVLEYNDPEERKEQALGALDMGGESLEVSFKFQPTSSESLGEVTASETAKYFSEVQFDDDDSFIFGESYVNMGHRSALQLGMLTASQSQELISLPPDMSSRELDSDQVLSYLSPCFHSGYVYVTDEEDRYFDIGTQFFGTGNWSECVQLVSRMLDISAECSFSHCSFGGHYEPPVHDFFIAMDDFATVASFFRLSYQPVINSFVPPTRDYCLMTWEELQEDDWYKHFKEGSLRRFCFQGVYVHLLLTAGLGLDGTKAHVVFADSLYDSPLNWGLGAMRQHLESRSRYYTSASEAADSDSDHSSAGSPSS